ncbi:hypothetical protein B7P43_G03665 [Cryptotermes secundus]|uniref:Sodium channel protein Nach n=1 Tax=Cryptotermes secundus TaxID=105785 RepID=A0A2J7Q3L3_9NEOP|nr:hypothetical protein B7P43_G03665 [Cryptotermes secundus]
MDALCSKWEQQEYKEEEEEEKERGETPKKERSTLEALWKLEIRAIRGEEEKKVDVPCIKKRKFRILWVVVVLVGLAASIVMLCAAWGRKDMNSTLIALNTAHYPVWNIEFPAITLCGLNRIKKSRAIIVANEWTLPSGVTRDEVFNDLIFLSQLIDMDESNATKFGRLQSVLDMNNITATVALREVMLPCEELLVKCKFKGKMINCKKVFRLLETPYGFCCSFNYHANKPTTKE